MANDCSEGGKLPISNRGVLLSVLGNSLNGAAVTADLDKTIADKLRSKKPFFEFEVKSLDKNHICISYQEQSNTVFIIGVSDLVISFATPIDIDNKHIKAAAVKLKTKPNAAILAKHAVLVRLEGAIGKARKLTFYLLEE